MAFKLDNNTIVLILVVSFLAWYFFSESRENFKQKKGIQRVFKGITQQIKTPPPPPPIVQAPPPPKIVVQPPPVQMITEDDSGLL
jgi:hypothetical protein